MCQNCNCQNCNCQNQNSNNATPDQIGVLITDVSNAIIALKTAGIIEQSTIDLANVVAITALNKLEEILQNVDAQKVNNKNNNNNQPIPAPMPVYVPVVTPTPMPPMNCPMPTPTDPTPAPIADPAMAATPSDAGNDTGITS